MEPTSLIAVCAIAFIAVFVLLSFLAAVMRLTTTVFPARDGGIDAAVVAAVSTAVSTILPGARVIQIEEE